MQQFFIGGEGGGSGGRLQLLQGLSGGGVSGGKVWTGLHPGEVDGKDPRCCHCSGTSHQTSPVVTFYIWQNFFYIFMKQFS